MIVDNASAPPLEIPRSGWDSFSDCNLVQEPRLGVAFGRRAQQYKIAIFENSRAPIIVFVDDDTVLDPEYLNTTFKETLRYYEIATEHALKIFGRFPRLGVADFNFYKLNISKDARTTKCHINNINPYGNEPSYLQDQSSELFQNGLSSCLQNRSCKDSVINPLYPLTPMDGGAKNKRS